MLVITTSRIFTPSSVLKLNYPTFYYIVNLPPGDNNSRAGAIAVNTCIHEKMALSTAELSPIAKISTPPSCEQEDYLEKTEVVRNDQQQTRDDVGIISPRSDEEEGGLTPFTLVNTDTGENFDLREIDKVSPRITLSPHLHEKHHATNIPQEQTRHNWRMRSDYADNVGDKPLNAESEKKAPCRWRRGKLHKKSSPGHDHRHGSSTTPDGYTRNSGGRKDGFFGNFSLFQELGNASGEVGVIADDESSDRANIKKGHTGPIWALEVSHDGQFVAWGGEDGCIVVTQISGFTKVEKEEVKNNDGGYNAMDAKHQQPILSVSSDDPAFDLSTGLFDKDPLHVFEGHTSDVICLAWSASSFLLSSSKDMTVRLWHVTQPQCLHIFQHSEIVTSVHFHPTHERFFLTGCFDKKVCSVCIFMCPCLCVITLLGDSVMWGLIVVVK